MLPDIRRIVELAQRLLSPGINDPTTALYCIDRLGQVLGRLAGRDIPSPMRLDEGGQLRVSTEVFDLGDVTCRAFAAIARYGMTDADVVTRLVEARIFATQKGGDPRPHIVLHPAWR